jgi:hypothetical protein
VFSQLLNGNYSAKDRFEPSNTSYKVSVVMCKVTILLLSQRDGSTHGDTACEESENMRGSEDWG